MSFWGWQEREASFNGQGSGGTKGYSEEGSQARALPGCWAEPSQPKTLLGLRQGLGVWAGPERGLQESGEGKGELHWLPEAS